MFVALMCLMLLGFITTVDAGTLNDKCLSCHAESSGHIEFADGEKLPVRVDAEGFRNSVHSGLSCNDCHREFNQKRHPERRFRSRKQYRIKLALVCRDCHSKEKLETRKIHCQLLAQEAAGAVVVCTDCHGYHSVKPVRGGMLYESERKYCMSCHGYDIYKSFNHRERISLKVNTKYLDSSVHRLLNCSDCHYGFSTDEHPKRYFIRKRDLSVALSENCKRCHFDKYAKILESIHYKMLSQGNINAPVCTDCHGYHNVVRIRRNRTLIVRRCRNCHGRIFEIYQNSVHGSALLNESNRDVPICIDCHKAHDIKNPLTLDFHELIPEICSNCHSNGKIMAKYGISTDVVKTYLSDFHGVTLGFYKKQREELYKPARPIAVCTDCHGTHDIVSTRSVEPKVLKAKLVKRCRKCHKNATENFPDAWLSHYQPSLKKAPCVYVVGLVYRIFIPVLVVGLGLQILLHVWRYAVNR